MTGVYSCVLMPQLDRAMIAQCSDRPVCRLGTCVPVLLGGVDLFSDGKVLVKANFFIYYHFKLKFRKWIYCKPPRSHVVGHHGYGLLIGGLNKVFVLSVLFELVQYGTRICTSDTYITTTSRARKY